MTRSGSAGVPSDAITSRWCLQGGGALGAYQAGVYEALHEAGIEPDWVSGVSIGAINAAIIAGNRREQRLERLRTFWDRITDRTIWALHAGRRHLSQGAQRGEFVHDGDAGAARLFCSAQDQSLAQRPPAQKSATSYYDTEPLRKTLLELVDFSLINDRRTRFSVGAVNVRSGNFLYFDNRD